MRLGETGEGSVSLPKAGHSHRVLVVDDNADMCDLYSAYLTFQGLLTETAADGAEAVRVTLSFRPDLIVMDLMMPIMTGFEAIQEIKRNPETAQIPVIALTASHEVETKRAAKEACCDCFLTKPCEPERLLAEVRRLLYR